MTTDRMVGHYRMVRALEQGGMGEVFIAHDEKLKRKVAIKSIRPDHRLDDAAKQRFLREARILSSLDHPYIGKIYDYIENEAGDFLVLEFIEGRTLALEAKGNLEPARRLRMAEQMGEALVTAHAEGIVHRDLKPRNVMVTPPGDIRILDFGLAHSGPARPSASSTPAPEPHRTDEDDPEKTLAYAQRDAIAPDGDSFKTLAGRITGTPFYMSPEQANGETVTSASDMYSYGLVLQYLFTGRGPYEEEIGSSLILEKAKRCETRPVEGVNRDLTALIEALKRPAPSERPTAVEALQRLRWIREKPRRWLRRGAIAALLLISVGVGVKYTLDLMYERGLAVIAQQEAERRRGEAEDLISFMLGDLRLRLEPVGRLDVLDAVGDKAMDYFASLPATDLDDEELFRRSTALRQIGEVRMANNNLPAASRSFEESLELAYGLVNRDPTNGEWQMGLGASEFWLGNIRWLQQNLDGALGHFLAYQTISETLVELDADNPTYQLEHSYGHTNLAAVYQEQGRLDLALPAIRKSIRIKQGLLEADPDNDAYESSLANGLSWLSSVQLQSGDLQAAQQTLEEELTRRREICDRDPLNMEVRYLLEVCHNQNGSLLMLLGGIEEAITHYRRMLALAEELTAHDPANKDWTRDLAVSHLLLGHALFVASDRNDKTAEHFQVSEDLVLELVNDDPSNIERRIDLTSVLIRRSAVALARQDIDGARDYADRALQLVDRMRAEQAETRRLTHIEASTCLNLGRALAARALPDDALEIWQRGLAAIEPLAANGTDPEDGGMLVMLLLNMQRLDEARPIVDDLLSRGYRQPDFIRTAENSAFQLSASDARLNDPNN